MKPNPYRPKCELTYRIQKTIDNKYLGIRRIIYCALKKDIDQSDYFSFKF